MHKVSGLYLYLKSKTTISKITSPVWNNFLRESEIQPKFFLKVTLLTSEN